MAMTEESLKYRIESFVLILDNFLSEGAWTLVGIVFFWAYFDDQDKVTVTVNEFGEKHPEAVLVPTLFLISVWGTHIKLKRVGVYSGIKESILERFGGDNG